VAEARESQEHALASMEAAFAALFERVDKLGEHDER
jgi:hypothetical protein